MRNDRASVARSLFYQRTRPDCRRGGFKKQVHGQCNNKIPREWLALWDFSDCERNRRRNIKNPDIFAVYKNDREAVEGLQRFCFRWARMT